MVITFKKCHATGMTTQPEVQNDGNLALVMELFLNLASFIASFIVAITEDMLNSYIFPAMNV